jgi:hypothetical protein
MVYYVLVWGLEGGLITVDMTSGQRMILAHTDMKPASRHMDALVQRAKTAVAIVEVESPESHLKKKLDNIVGAGLLSRIDLVFPEDQIYLAILNELLTN